VTNSNHRFPSSIVVATDFSACSGVALSHALRIAQRSGAALHVVHMIDTHVVSDMQAASPLRQSIQEGLEAQARQAWKRFAAGIPGASELAIEIGITNRSVGIVERAKQDGADLIVLGAFGDRRPDVGFGTVASACVRRSACDVMLVRDTQRGPFTRVLAAVDFSATSRIALERAAEMARGDGAELHVVHIYQNPWQGLVYGEAMIIVSPEDEAQIQRDMEARLSRFAQPVLDAAGMHATLACVQELGHRHGIAGVARSMGAQLVVLGTRGRSNLRDVFLGSTAERTLAEAHCSVLAVKPTA
jgi:universal stress protein E